MIFRCIKFQSWSDSRLSWNYTEMPVDIIVVPAIKVWLPDINLANS